MRTDIVVFAYNRPRYLYVMLDSLFRVKHIDRHSVYVYVDGVLDAETRAFTESLIESFPVTETMFHSEHIDNVDGMMYGISQRFADGADEVLFLEDDYLLKPNILLYAEQAPRTGFFTNLSSSLRGLACGYSPRGNIIGREQFEELRSWVQGRQYAGLERPVAGGLLTAETTGHDGIFYCFLVQHGYMSSFPGVFYLAHFGLAGRNAPVRDADFVDLENRMFAGEKHCWMENIISILEQEEYPKRFELRLWPRGFKYRG